MSNCPFKVGDRIKPTPLMTGYYNADEDEWVVFQHPSADPEATVTDITIEGFKYKYDEMRHICPRLGLSFDSGICYPEGYSSWELVNP